MKAPAGTLGVGVEVSVGLAGEVPGVGLAVGELVDVTVTRTGAGEGGSGLGVGVEDEVDVGIGVSVGVEEGDKVGVLVAVGSSATNQTVDVGLNTVELGSKNHQPPHTPPIPRTMPNIIHSGGRNRLGTECCFGSRAGTEPIEATVGSSSSKNSR